MRYEFTDDLLTGNPMIDSQHRQLITILNELFEACASGHGQAKIPQAANFLNRYVEKHFGDEEKLQLTYAYPHFKEHKTFHNMYKTKLKAKLVELQREGPSLRLVNTLNAAATRLISHIRHDDKKLALYIQAEKEKRKVASVLK